jgi:hypothetical protein
MLVCAILVLIAHETAGAACTRHSPLPLFEGECFASLGQLVPREGERMSLNVIARSGATKQSIAPRKGRMDCFVARAPLRKRFAFVAGNDAERPPRRPGPVRNRAQGAGIRRGLSMRAMALDSLLKHERRGVWVPAFAGTTNRPQPPHRFPYPASPPSGPRNRPACLHFPQPNSPLVTSH